MNVTLNVQDLMPVLPAVLGLVVAGAVELVTKAAAPAALKRSVAAVLALLAGVIPTVVLTPHTGARVYLAAVLSAWVVAITTHAAGLTGWLQNATASTGLGSDTPTGGTPGMVAGAPTPGEVEQQDTEQDTPAPAPAPIEPSAQIVPVASSTTLH